MRSVQILCEGRVQGVFFRKYTQDKALSLGLKGWVKNQVNGSVLIYATGSKESVDLLVKWCYQGSPMSSVTSVRITDVEELDVVQKFEVRY